VPVKPKQPSEFLTPAEIAAKAIQEANGFAISADKKREMLELVQKQHELQWD
jgi:hypothetical protein